MNLLERSWQRAWENLGLSAPAPSYDRLIAAYREPHRHYHSLQHLAECLAHLEGAEGLAVRPGEVEIALWFHDAVYELKGSDNERRSADWAAEVLTACGAPAPVVQRVEALIMATRHDASPEDADQQLLVDIDLAILGAPPARFLQYDQQVKAEYSWVPGPLYRFKRKEVLRGFLARDRIYLTAHFREAYETQARANLQAVVG